MAPEQDAVFYLFNRQLKGKTMDIFEATAQFNREVLGMPRPEKPSRLHPERKNWTLTALHEELTELEEATELVDEVDALVDLMYFAGGRLYEMGVNAGACLAEVHRANMSKVRGELSKRPGARGFDAVKPDGWRAPDVAQCLDWPEDIDWGAVSEDPEVRHALERMHDVTPAERTATAREMLAGRKLRGESVLVTGPWPGRPRIVVLGHARHGKDTVCEMLRDRYGLRFQSSSEFCAEHVVWPAMQHAYEEWIEASAQDQLLKAMGPPVPLYASAAACFADRGNHRAYWYDTIRNFNRPDPTALARSIFARNDVYCGLRHRTEFHAVFNAGLADLVLWVDASDRVPPEDASSCSVEPWMAHFVIDNNGDQDDLVRNVESLMEQLLGEYTEGDD